MDSCTSFCGLSSINQTVPQAPKKTSAVALLIVPHNERQWKFIHRFSVGSVSDNWGYMLTIGHAYYLWNFAGI